MSRTETAHLSAALHATGEALYADDCVPPDALHATLAIAQSAGGRLLAVDLRAAAVTDGVVAILTAADLKARRTIGPIRHDEPVFTDAEVATWGAPVALVVATTREAAMQAASQVVATVEGSPLPPDLASADDAGIYLTDPHVITWGDVAAAEASAAIVFESEVETPAQDHFPLETHASWASVSADGSVHVVASTQHPTEMAREIAAVLGLPEALVRVEVPRMGGGFGGKESQSTPMGVWAALAARHTGRPVVVRFDRRQHMGWTGKRHPFRARSRAAFDATARLVSHTVDLVSDGGASLDLSGPVMDRALFHLDAGCFTPNGRFTGRVARTSRPSNTAFRGFGAPQGLAVTATVLQRAARHFGLPLEEVWRRNVYTEGRDVAPYGQVIEDPRGAAVLARVCSQSDIEELRREVDRFNASSVYVKRGVGVAVATFGISFTNAMLNQAGAVVNVYTDGSVRVHHGGTEMGQGLHTKVATLIAARFGLPIGRVIVADTDTGIVPNTSATAASSGTDLNGAAAMHAADAIAERLATVAATSWGVDPSTVRFEDGSLHSAVGSRSFADVAQAAWVQRVPLSAAGTYATPGIQYDRVAGRGTPFAYHTFGAAVVEVEVHGLTGEHRMRRIDIVQDCGRSIAPLIDRGQIEGAFIQGAGWLTTEEVRYDGLGRVTTLGPSTYKIPSAGDVPAHFQVTLLPNADAPRVVGHSKAVGEPPLNLAVAVPAALREAIGAFGPGEPILGLPASPERILAAIDAVRRG